MMNTQEIWLIRHAKTNENTNFIMIGHTDSPLSEEGLHDARALAHLLCEQPVSRLFSSPLQRALDTARSLAEVHHPPLNVTISPLLSELHLGDMEGMSSFDAYENQRETMEKALDPTRHDFAFPNGEWRSDAIERWERFLNQTILSSEWRSPVWIVTHGALIGLWLAKIYELPLGRFRDMQPNHASITKVTVLHDGRHILKVNMATHLNRINPSAKNLEQESL